MTKINLKSGRTNEIVGYVRADEKGNITINQFKRQVNKLDKGDYLLAEKELTIVDKYGDQLGSVEADWTFDYEEGIWVNEF